MDEFTLTVDGNKYDLAVLVDALTFSHDYALAEDVRNAVKNGSHDVKTSPLTQKCEAALEVLQEMASRAAGKPGPAVVDGTVTDDPADPDAS